MDDATCEGRPHLWRYLCGDCASAGAWWWTERLAVADLAAHLHTESCEQALTAVTYRCVMAGSWTEDLWYEQAWAGERPPRG